MSGDIPSGSEVSSMELPHRMFPAGQEPVGERVNVYHENCRIQNLLDAISEEEKNRLMKTVFGPFLEKIGKIAYSGSFGHYLLTKQLWTEKKREVWILFAGCPIRFSLREFKIVTSLPCKRYPPPPKKRKRIEAGDGDYYNKLFGRDGSVEVDEIIRMLERNKPSDPEIRFKYICLCVLDGFLMPTSHHPKISKDHAEMIRNLDDFLKYPWGRAAFDLVINSIKERDPVSISQRTVAIQGFYYALQLVMIEAVPALCEKPSPLAKYTDSDGETEELARPPSKIVSDKSAKNYVIPGYAKALDGKNDLVVDSIILYCGDEEGDEEEEDLSFPVDTEDALVDNLMKLIHDEAEFSNKMFTGGFTPADIVQMKLEKDREKKAENEKKPKRTVRRAAPKTSLEMGLLPDDQAEKIAELVAEKLKTHCFNPAQPVSEAILADIETRISCRLDKSLQEMQKNILMVVSGLFSKPPEPHQNQVNNTTEPHHNYDAHPPGSAIGTPQGSVSDTHQGSDSDTPQGSESDAPQASPLANPQVTNMEDPAWAPISEIARVISHEEQQVVESESGDTGEEREESEGSQPKEMEEQNVSAGTQNPEQNQSVSEVISDPPISHVDTNNPPEPQAQTATDKPNSLTILSVGLGKCDESTATTTDPAVSGTENTIQNLLGSEFILDPSADPPRSQVDTDNPPVPQTQPATTTDPALIENTDGTENTIQPLPANEVMSEPSFNLNISQAVPENQQTSPTPKESVSVATPDQPNSAEVQKAGEGIYNKLKQSTLATYGRRSRRKRQRIPTSKIGEEFVCDPKIKTGPGAFLPKWATHQVLKKYDGVAKQLLRAFSLKLADETSIQSSEMLNLVGRQKEVSNKMVDSLMFLTRHLFKGHYASKVDKGIQFFDTKFAASLIKQFAKFKKAGKHTYTFQPLQFELMNGVRNPMSNDALADVKLIYFPFNIDKKHWVGVCLSLEEKKLTILDSNSAFRKTDLLVKDLTPLAEMFPYLIKDSSVEGGKITSFTCERISGISQNSVLKDSALSSVLLIQAHATGGFAACRALDPRFQTDEAKKMVVLLYELFF